MAFPHKHKDVTAGGWGLCANIHTCVVEMSAPADIIQIQKQKTRIEWSLMFWLTVVNFNIFIKVI